MKSYVKQSTMVLSLKMITWRLARATAAYWTPLDVISMGSRLKMVDGSFCDQILLPFEVYETRKSFMVATRMDFSLLINPTALNKLKMITNFIMINLVSYLTIEDSYGLCLLPASL